MDHSDIFEECLQSVKSEELDKMECGVKEELEDFSSQGLKSDGVAEMKEGDERLEEKVKQEDPLPQVKPREACVAVKPSVAVDPLAHPEDCSFSCQYCGFETPASNVLKEHILNIREDQCPISCSQCTFNCSDLPTLRVHRHYWHGEESAHPSHSFGNSLKSLRDIKVEEELNLRAELGETEGGDIRDSEDEDTPQLDGEEDTMTGDSDEVESRQQRLRDRTHLKPPSWTADYDLSAFCEDNSNTVKPREACVAVKPSVAVDPLAHPEDCSFSCQYCGFETPASNVLKEHILNRREDQCPISCSQCTFNCSDLPTLRVHRHYWHGEESAHPSPASGHSSVQTGRSTDRPHYLPLRPFTGVQPSHSNDRFYACPHCEYSCVLHSSLIRHIQACRFNDRSHSCQLCEYTCGGYPALRRHIIECHSNGSSFTCPYCEYSCPQMLSLKRHIRTSHSVDLPLSSPATGQPSLQAARSQADKQEESAQSGKLPLDDKLTGSSLSALPSEEKSITVPCLDVLGTRTEVTASSQLKSSSSPLPASLGSGCYSCDVCPARVTQSSDLKTHEGIHTEEKAYSCSVCQARFTQLCHLKNHHDAHTKETPYVCDVCLARFARSSDLKAHKGIHTEEKPYTCDVCLARFARYSDLKAHKGIHTKEKPYTCDVCSARFALSSDLKAHKGIHTKEKPYTCDVCSARFSQSSSLRTHQKIHTKEKRHACDVCPARFTQSSNLKTHKKIHSKKKAYSCSVCQARFTQLCHLKNHHSTHTKEKPYACDVCQATFARSSDLKVHMRTHTQVKPYVCDVCSARFTQSSNLRTHEKIHTKEKRYACDVCPDRFTQLPLLNKHRITHFNESPTC